MSHLNAGSTLIDALHDEDAFNRLVEAHPPYRRLAHVLLREDIAGRLSLADVAHMGDVPVDSVVHALSGGAAPAPKDAVASAMALPEGRPDWADTPGAGEVSFDARPLLDNGQEPLPAILDAFDSAPAGAPVAISATFHPLPLRRLMAGRGYESSAECVGPAHWRVHFRFRPGQGPGQDGD